MSIDQTPTRDLRPDRAIGLPIGCVTSASLHELARTLDRLLRFHGESGGAAADAPCLIEVGVQGRAVFARVRSGERMFRLELVGADWVFC